MTFCVASSSSMPRNVLQAGQKRDAWRQQWGQDKARLVKERNQLASEVEVNSFLNAELVFILSRKHSCARWHAARYLPMSMRSMY